MQFKVKTFNKDGTVEFEGVFDANEASIIMQAGVSYLLHEGLIPFISEEEEDEEDLSFTVEGSGTIN